MSRFDLVAFDVDGTLIADRDGRTVWEVLNGRYLGDSTINRERYARFRRGEISYAEWVALDVEGWRDAGATRDEVTAVLREDLRLVPGTRETLGALGAAGARLIAVSGTLDLLLHAVYPDHPFEEVYANHLGFDACGRISHWRATPFDMEGKGRLLRAVALREGLSLSRCAFVGDSVNDVWIARTAGFSVAWNPKSEDLEREADAVVRGDDLRAILPHLLGGEG